MNRFDQMSPSTHGPRRRSWLLSTVVALCAVSYVACRDRGAGEGEETGDEAVVAAPYDEPSVDENAAGGATLATATLRSHADYQVEGTVRFEQSGDTVTVTAGLSGLPPGEHGFHVHETGDCSAPGFETAGSHFNPAGAPHGDPTGDSHHAGDFGNLTAGSDGQATLVLQSSDVSLAEGDQSSIVGRAIIVHLNPDTFAQPDGNAGPRIACGVIELAEQQAQDRI